MSVNRELAERKFPVLIQYSHVQTIEVVGWIYQMFKSSVLDVSPAQQGRWLH